MNGYMRRLLIVVVALIGATVILHEQISTALLVRGDALAYWGDHGRAQSKYRLALLFDRDNGVAVDRLSFAALMSHRIENVEPAIAIASAYLARHPADVSVRMDRALCWQRLAMLQPASDDFERVGLTSHDVRALMFAALDAKRLHDIERSRRLLHQALEIDRSFEPARHLALALVTR